MIRKHRLYRCSEKRESTQNMENLIHSQRRSLVVFDVIGRVVVNEDEDHMHNDCPGKESMHEKENLA